MMRSKHVAASASMLALAVWIAVPGVVVATSCAGATQIIVEVQADACAKVQSTDIVSAADEQSLAVATASQASQQGCAAAPRIGTAVFVPDGANDQEIVIRVTTGITKMASLCKEGDDGCIVAKRRARFVPNETVRVLVVMTLACSKVACAANETCDPATGKCMVIGGVPNTTTGGDDAGGSDATVVDAPPPKNGCDATGCVWQCDTKDACSKTKCDAGKPCVINCNVSGACSDVSCGDASACDIRCNVDGACTGLTKCSSKGACAIQCATKSACDGDMSCSCVSLSATCNVTCGPSSCDERNVCCCADGRCKLSSSFKAGCG